MLISLFEVKDHLKLEHDDSTEDALLNTYINAAIETIENQIDRSLADFNQPPFSLKAAALIFVAHLYEVREPVVIGVSAAKVPMSAEFLMQPYKRHSL